MTSNNIWLFRFCLITVLLTLFFLCAQYPLFTEVDLNKHNEEKIALYFAEVVEGHEEKDINRYVVRFMKSKVNVASDDNLEKGDIVSFYGIVDNSTLISEKHHIHKYPDLTYPLSISGLFIFLIIFAGAWKFDIKNRVFVKRGKK